MCLNKENNIETKIRIGKDLKFNTSKGDLFKNIEVNREYVEEIISTTGSNNCGNRCFIQAKVEDGILIELNAREDCGYENPNLMKACGLGKNYRASYFNPNRLKYPMKRVGKRGEGKFERISWQEAIDIIGDKTSEIKANYGANSRFVYFGHNQNSLINSDMFLKRLLSLDGGFLDYYNNPNTYRIENATRYMYGTTNTGNSLNDWKNSKLIILWGHNPAETIFATGMHYLREAKKAGAKIIVIDPKYNDTAVSLADEWIPIHPNTDAALMDAMAYVMLKENLYDREFIDKYSVGFDEKTMPDGIGGVNSYSSYLLGKFDGVEKTPKWAEKISKVPVAIIENLAREYAKTKPAALIQGWGPQRNKYGEQIVRGGITLATMTGNIGINGGWASGIGHIEKELVPTIPLVKSQGSEKISIEKWLDNAKNGRIKALYNLGGNILLDNYREKEELLRDESKIEFILSSDIFLSKSSMFADIVLPSDTSFERYNISKPWNNGDLIVFGNKVINPPFEVRGEYEWMMDLAEKLKLKEEFTMGNTGLEDWSRWMVEELQKMYEDFPSFEDFKRQGSYRWKEEEVFLAFKNQIDNLDENPFPTKSGKIEIFSKDLYEDGELPFTPKYLGDEDFLDEYKLKYIEHHTKRKCHPSGKSRLGDENERPIIWINPLDIEGKNISIGSRIKIFNDSGYSIGFSKITNKIVPGTVSIPSGSWIYTDKKDKLKKSEGKVNVELYNE